MLRCVADVEPHHSCVVASLPQMLCIWSPLNDLFPCFFTLDVENKDCIFTIHSQKANPTVDEACTCNPWPRNSVQQAIVLQGLVGNRCPMDQNSVPSSPQISAENLLQELGSQP